MYTGGLDKAYGLDMLLEGFIAASIPDSELHIYGAGKFAEEIKKAAEKIVKLAEHPVDMEFQTAVKNHRYKEKCLKKYEELVSKVNEQIRALPEKEGK